MILRNSVLKVVVVLHFFGMVLSDTKTKKSGDSISRSGFNPVDFGITTVEALLKTILAPINGLKGITPVPFIIDTEIQTTDKIIRNFGYAVESHIVTTPDGYILKLFRIPTGKDGDETSGKTPVLLTHGFLGSSTNYVLNERREQNLATILADQGFDVWISNWRGNEYSQAHVNLSTSSDEYWNFSWEEMGYYDLPSFIDFILKITGQPKLSLVSYSLGATASLVTLSTNVSYNDKIKVAVLLGPVTYITDSTNLLFKLATALIAIQDLVELITHGMLFPFIKNARSAISASCSVGILDIALCQTTFEILVSSDINNFNKTRLPFFLSQYPDAGSFKTVLHYAKGALAKKFQMYDYGPAENLKRYNQTSPPNFNVGRISVPVAIITSETDNTADQKDVDFLRQEGPNLISDLVLSAKEDYNHYDFLYSQNAYEKVYPWTLDQLNKFE